nr:MAG TPA: hypothetical protein [Caudoviricetes sp.]
MGPDNPDPRPWATKQYSPQRKGKNWLKTRTSRCGSVCSPRSRP